MGGLIRPDAGTEETVIDDRHDDDAATDPDKAGE